MRYNKVFLMNISMALMFTLGLSGCTIILQKGRRTDIEKIAKMRNDMDELQRAKDELEKRLQNEINNKQVKVEMENKGLVITFVSEVLFNSGKAKLRRDSYAKLDKVANVLNTTVSDLDIGIEGHTDNVPIKHSHWKSNWELSTARALSVLHYLVSKDVAQPRLSAIGYGEFRPVASNATAAGRQANRRVEIVVFPKNGTTTDAGQGQ
ncbi:MAG: OmpA family protein [Candidatus Omnitrophica bacterium]|nr:OmpA family protein [Candidatus Omnitrophota bacterium]MDE2009962.1 OmpA family protein [Candidatus Omnitrophota bacterium]MDE2213940.1 OmpA family protein [Candidatus Omnitrophota bacterium]MDE2231910.1 OmpA family protein [Candidatus Omnitrophota bacterium]